LEAALERLEHDKSTRVREMDLALATKLGVVTAHKGHEDSIRRLLAEAKRCVCIGEMRCKGR
jgi:hypothetical protein